ncbi:MAG: metallophosphoesterase, partial [Flavitalea sp.]
MRNPGFLWIIIGFMLILDIYVFQAIKVVIPGSSQRIRNTVMALYWIFAIITLLVLIAFPYVNFDTWPKAVRTYLFSLLVALFFSKLIASMFFAVDDIRRGITWMLGKLFSNPSVEISQASSGITRSVFLSWLGLAMGGGLFGTLIYGFSNKYNYHIKRMKLAFDNLPAAFKGMKIVHISDIHSGSFMDKKAVQKGIDKILKEKPDLILFTGDLVNDRATEMKEYMDVFGRLKAPMGVFSTLGNHDYGD